MSRTKILTLLFVFLLFCRGAEALAWGPDEGSGQQLSFMKEEEEKKGFYQKGAPALALFLLAGVAGYGVFVWNRKRGAPESSTIRVVAVKPLGQREKVAILEILGERVVLGVTAHRISLLLRTPSRFSQSLRVEDEQR